MYARLCKHIKANNMLKYQFGFGPNCSTSLALFHTIDEAYKKLDTG